MRLVLDFAAKFSAGMVMDRSGEVKYQFDSWGKTIFEFAEEVADTASEFEVNLIIVEDIPHGIKFLAQTKPPATAQGVLWDELNRVDELDKARLLQPAIWQRHFEGVWKGGWQGAQAAAQLLGYTHPDLITVHEAEIPPKAPENTKARADIRAKLRKAQTDYNDAFLIGRWSLDVGDEEVMAATTEPLNYTKD